MGYWIEQVESVFFIAQEDQYDALSALCQRVRAYYQRYPSDDYKQALTAETLAEALSCFDWELTEDDLGNAIDITYKRYRWVPLPAFFFDMAPYIRSGSYILMHHEDTGDGMIQTKYTFTGTTVIEEQKPSRDTSAADVNGVSKKLDRKRKRRRGT